MRSRKDFSLEDGMVIKLERFSDKYSREKHAEFVDASSDLEQRRLFWRLQNRKDSYSTTHIQRKAKEGRDRNEKAV